MKAKPTHKPLGMFIRDLRQAAGLTHAPTDSPTAPAGLPGLTL